MLKVLLNNIDLVLLALVILFLLINLNKLLGKRGETPAQENKTPEDSTIKEPTLKFKRSILDVKAKEKIITKNDATDKPTSTEITIEKTNPYPEGSLMYNITNLAIKDKSFELKSFLDFAKSSFTKIITNFNAGKIEEVQFLLSTNMYNNFLNYINNNANFEKTKVIIKSFILADITSLNWVENIANVKVKFITKQLSLQNNEEESTASTNKEKIVEETWVFSKDFNSSNSSWLLTKTE